MTQPAIKCLACLALLTLSVFSPAQSRSESRSPLASAADAKPYKIITNGTRITVKSTGNFNKLLVWTSSGHRIHEQNNLNTNSYSFSVPAKEKVFFLLLEFPNGKRYTEKIGKL